MGLVNPTSYNTTASSSGAGGIGQPAESANSAQIADLKIGPSFGVQDVNTQLKFIGAKLPHRGEMEIVQTNDAEVTLFAFSRWGSRSTWIAAGLLVLGLGAGYVAGRSYRRK
jgi:hypothetical protein